MNLLALEYAGERLLNRALVGYVTNVRGSSASCRENLLTSGNGCALIDVQHFDSSPMLCETQGDGLPNAAAGAGNDRNFAVEPKIGDRIVRVGQRETPRFQGMKSSCAFCSALVWTFPLAT